MSYSLGNLDPEMLEEIRDQLETQEGKILFLSRLSDFLGGRHARAVEKDIAFSTAAELNAAGIFRLISVSDLAASLRNLESPKVAAFLDALPKSLIQALIDEIKKSGVRRRAAPTRKKTSGWEIAIPTVVQRGAFGSMTVEIKDVELGPGVDVEDVKFLRFGRVAKAKSGAVVAKGAKSAKSFRGFKSQKSVAGSALSGKSQTAAKLHRASKAQSHRANRKNSAP